MRPGRPDRQLPVLNRHQRCRGQRGGKLGRQDRRGRGMARERAVLAGRARGVRVRRRPDPYSGRRVRRGLRRSEPPFQRSATGRARRDGGHGELPRPAQPRLPGRIARVVPARVDDLSDPSVAAPIGCGDQRPPRAHGTRRRRHAAGAAEHLTRTQPGRERPAIPAPELLVQPCPRRRRGDHRCLARRVERPGQPSRQDHRDHRPRMGNNGHQLGPLVEGPAGRRGQVVGTATPRNTANGCGSRAFARMARRSTTASPRLTSQEACQEN